MQYSNEGEQLRLYCRCNHVSIISLEPTPLETSIALIHEDLKRTVSRTACYLLKNYKIEDCTLRNIYSL